MRSRQTFKQHFFTLSQAQLHSWLLYPVQALQGQQLLQERSAYSSLSSPLAAGNTGFTMVQCLWPWHSPCHCFSLFVFPLALSVPCFCHFSHKLSLSCHCHECRAQPCPSKPSGTTSGQPQTQSPLNLIAWVFKGKILKKETRNPKQNAVI